MTERKTNEDWKKVVHSNAEDVAKYYSCFGVAAAKRGGMRSEGCLPANQNATQSHHAAATFSLCRWSCG